MKASNYIKNDCDQETAKEYSTIVQIIVKDDRGKAISWRSVSCKMPCYHVSDEKTVQILSLQFCTRSAVCSLHLVPSRHFYPVCSLHSLLTRLVLLFLFERASSPDRNIGARKEILVRLSWPLWLMCGLYVEEHLRKSTMTEQWLLYTNWGRTQMHGLTIWLPLIPFCVVTACVEMNSIQVPQVWTFQLLDLLNHTNILFLSARVSELHRN